MARDERGDFERILPFGFGAFHRQIILYGKGTKADRTPALGGKDAEASLHEELTEFGEVELDVARTAVWTKELEDANDQWYRCKRNKGYADFGACMEEGAVVRRENWRHQLQIKESGCERHLFRYAKCLQRAERQPAYCRDMQETFVSCCINAGNMNLVPDVPPALKRPEKYFGFFPMDVAQYRRWIKNRDKFLEAHPDWFAEDDLQLMDAKQLYSFISKKQHWLDDGDLKPFSTFSFPMRWREYIPRKDRFQGRSRVV